MSLVDLAHVTDVHLGPLPRAQLAELLSKRALGYLSWRRRRHLLHKQTVLDALALDLAADPPDHIAVTGDLVNIALPGEFEQAARWLEATGTSSEVTLVPGNHDAYAGKSYRQGWTRWDAYMRGDDQAIARMFPFVRRIDRAWRWSGCRAPCRAPWATPRASSARPSSRPWTNSWPISVMPASAGWC